MTNAEASFNIALRPRNPEGSIGRKAQGGHLDSHTAPELWLSKYRLLLFILCRRSLQPRNSALLLSAVFFSFGLNKIYFIHITIH